MRATEPIELVLRLPLRLALAAGRLGARAAVGLAESLLDGGDGRAHAPDAPEPRPGSDPAIARAAARAREVAERRAPADFTPRPRPGVPDTAKTIDDEPVLVAETAEPGAAGDTGPEVEVAPPWEEYDRATAAAVAKTLRSASDAAVAAVRLYEAQGKRRATVLAAADRELRRRANAPR